MVENLIGENCPPDIQYTVFCSSKDMPSCPKEYKGARLRYIRLSSHGIASIPYDMQSMLKSLREYDILLILGVSGCMLLPALRMVFHKKIIVNIDGLEHRRAKWGKMARKFLKTSEAMAVKYADVIVADNKGIQDYVKETYGKKAELIAYGGDQSQKTLPEEYVNVILDKYGMTKGEYAVTVCRIEPENNPHIILEAFRKSGKDLLFIGNWNNSEWSRELRDKYSRYSNLHLQDAIYDIDVLYALRSSAGLYIHGHSAGGTNPSLVEAMFFGIPILAYDVVYNRETTENKAMYFSGVKDLKHTLNNFEFHKPSKLASTGNMMRNIAQRRYRWKVISNSYVELFRHE